MDSGSLATYNGNGKYLAPAAVEALPKPKASSLMPGYNVFGDGMFFGEVAVLFSVKCTATVRTVTYCDLLSLSKEGLGDAMRDYPKAANIISSRAKERMKQLGIQTSALREMVGPSQSSRAH